MSTMSERLLPLPLLTIKDLYRFWSKISGYGTDGCWEWTSSLTEKSNHGQFYLQGRNYYAHRLSYFIHYKIDPSKFVVCHDCDNPKCVNPKHLYLGTYSDNNQDKYDRERQSNKGINCPARKYFNDQNIRDIRQLIIEGKSPPEIAKIYGVSSKVIRRIKYNETWSHIR